MANKVYIAPETSITWTDSGGDEALDLGGLAADAGRQGDQRDLGAGSRAVLYEWILFIDGFDTAPVVGQTVDLYFAQSNGTEGDGAGVSFSDTGDGALASTNILPNLKLAGSVVVRSTTAADDIVARGVVALTSRYVVPVVHNNTADALLSTSDGHKVILTPVPPEVQ